MPADYGLLNPSVRLNTPFENLSQVLQVRAQQENMRGLKEQREAIAEQRRAQTEKIQRETAEATAVRALFTRVDPTTSQPQTPTMEELAGVIGPEKAADVFKGFEAVRTARHGNAQSDINRIASVLGGLEALPEAMRSEAYTGALQVLTADGTLKPGQAPATYNPAFVKAKRREALTALQQFEQDKPIEVTAGASLMSPGGQVIGTAPPAPKEPTKPASAQEYEYAVGQGYKGSYQQYQNEDANRRRPVVNVNATGEGLDPAGQDLLATQYRILGNSAIPTRISGADRARIINQAAAQMKALGQSPAVAIQRQAARKADAQSLNKITQMASTAEAFENKASQQADLVRELSARVDRTRFPILNKALLEGKKEILGDADTQQLFNALTTFTSEYAKIIEGSTGSAAGSSDAARKASASLASAAMNKDTLAKTLDLMQKEMRYTIEGYGATLDHITTRMGGTPQAPAGSPSAPPPAGGISYQDYLRSRKGGG